MASIDRWNEATESHYTVDYVDTVICEECGEEVYLGEQEAVFVSSDDEYFCDIDCYLKHNGARWI